MRRFQSSHSVILASLLAAFLSACGNKNETPAPPATASEAKDHPLPTPPAIAHCEPGISGGRLVLALFGDPKTFNPITSSETSSTDLTLRMNGGLVIVDAPTEKP